MWKRVFFLCDNSGVVAAIQKGSSIESLVVCACSDHCGSLWHVLMFCLVLGTFLGYLRQISSKETSNPQAELLRACRSLHQWCKGLRCPKWILSGRG